MLFKRIKFFLVSSVWAPVIAAQTLPLPNVEIQRELQRQFEREQQQREQLEQHPDVHITPS
jgi:hypothetical protein